MVRALEHEPVVALQFAVVGGVKHVEIIAPTTRVDQRQHATDRFVDEFVLDVCHRVDLAHVVGGLGRIVAVRKEGVESSRRDQGIDLLDEPSLGLAPLVIEQIFETINTFRTKMGLTVVLVEQNAMSALEIADIGIIINLGHVVATGKANELINDPALRAAYLGY